jgi:hypothetical protein
MSGLLTGLLLSAMIIWFLGLLLKFNGPHIAGALGEKFVSDKLLGLDPTKYAVLNDLLLPSTGSLTTTQIDHVVVSNFGIFVLETKSFTGWIFGNAQQKYWTQVIYRYRKRFYNPLHQNYAHIKAIEAVIRRFYPTIPVIGFVVFPSASKIQVSNTSAVGYARDTVRKILSYKTMFISETEKADIVHILSAYNIRDKGFRNDHVRNVRSFKLNRDS